MVAHDLREDSGISKYEAIRRMTRKRKQIWKFAKEDVIDVGLQTPFAIAMIYTFYDYFPSNDYPQTEAGPWMILRVRREDSGTLVRDPTTWEPLVETLKKWLDGRTAGVAGAGGD
jgi:hypothetical protein